MTEYHVGDVVELVKRGTVTALDNHSPSVLCVDGVWYGSPFDIRLITPAPKKWKVGDVIEGFDEYQESQFPDGTFLSAQKLGSPDIVKINGHWVRVDNGWRVFVGGLADPRVIRNLPEA